MPTCEWPRCGEEGTHTVLVRFPDQDAETWTLCRAHDRELKFRAIDSRPRPQPPEPTKTTTDIHCGKCGVALEEDGGIPAEERTPCRNCGSLLRCVKVGIFETLSFHESVRIRSRRAGKGGWLVDSRSGDDYTRLLGEWGKRELTLDRAADGYREVIELSDGTRIESTARLRDHRG